MKNETKIPTKMLDMVYLVSEGEAKQELGEAFASFMLNPSVVWAKFILTDDRKNGNGQRVPRTEFSNLIKSGIHMPVKMAMGEIAPGHDDSKPLGVITHLKEIELEGGAAAVVALAALWAEERPADVSFIKERFAQQQPVDVSWEILYRDEVFNPELGSIDLLSTFLKAATVVGNPAYKGRTPFLAISAKKADAKEDDTEEIITEDLTVDPKELQEKLDAATARITELEAQLQERETAVAELTTQKETLEAEIAPLKEFKETADAKAAEAAKLDQIKTKFVEAGLEKDEEYFVSNRDNLLAMPETQLNFMLQELKAFASSVKTTEASTQEKKTEIPAIHSQDDGDEPTLKDMAQYLRNRKGKK